MAVAYLTDGFVVDNDDDEKDKLQKVIRLK